MSRASLPNRKSSGCLELPELLRVSSCLSLVKPYKGALPPTNHFGCAEGALRFAAPSPPLRGPYLFCAGMAWDASGGILFSGLSEKSMQKRDAGERNSAYAPEKLFVSLYVLSFCFRRLNALRAAVGSGFPSARYTMRVALFAPVEYLTYGSRKAVLFTRAAMHIAHKRTSAQGTSETDAEYFDYNADLSNTHLHRVL